MRRAITYRLRELQLKRVWNIPLKELPCDMDDVNKEILQQLRTTRIGWLDYPTRQVYKRLARMYPNDDSWFYRAMISEERAKIAN
jgi:hypothetical protein